MKDSFWGLLGPGNVDTSRSILTFEVGSAVRQFNNLAVPGMGNLWFVRQLFLSMLGIHVAEEVQEKGAKSKVSNIKPTQPPPHSPQEKDAKSKVSNMEVANAIEAFSCYLTYENNGWKADPRLRGVNKMKNRTEDDFSFNEVRKKSFYVSQPLRMGTTQALMALKLVTDDSFRFNNFQLTDEGDNLVKDFIRLGNDGELVKLLCKWVEDMPPEKLFRHKADFNKFLSPLAPIPHTLKEKVKQIILNYGPEQDRKRRKGILDWVADVLNRERFTGWEKCPPQLDVAHWNDLRAGARFLKTRNAAWEVFKELADALTGQNDLSLEKGAKIARAPLGNLKQAANDFLVLDHDPTENKTATLFCKECCTGYTDIIKNLIKRDRKVLRLRQNRIEQGVAFKSDLFSRNMREAEDAEEEIELRGLPGLPDPVAPRVINMAYLSMDFNGQLSKWLNKK